MRPRGLWSRLQFESSFVRPTHYLQLRHNYKLALFSAQTSEAESLNVLRMITCSCTRMSFFNITSQHSGDGSCMLITIISLISHRVPIAELYARYEHTNTVLLCIYICTGGHYTLPSPLSLVSRARSTEWLSVCLPTRFGDSSTMCVELSSHPLAKHLTIRARCSCTRIYRRATTEPRE